MKLIDCARSVRRNFIVILLVGLSAGAVAYVLAGQQTDVYESSGRLVLGLSRSVADTTKGAALNNVSNRQVIATFAEVVGSSSVKSNAFEQAGVDGDGYHVTTVRLPEANGIEVRVDGPSPEKVQAATVQVMRLGAARFSTLYPDFVASSIDAPDVPDTPIEPRPKVMGLVALVLGLLVGFVVGLGIDQWRASRISLAEYEAYLAAQADGQIDDE